MIHLVECPRDAMQGIHPFIPTDTKIAYLNKLLKVGFSTLDFGSFVSPKAIPQLRDTAEVLQGLTLNDQTKLLAIVVNERGAQSACAFTEITYLGFPFSISETFQQRNANSSIAASFDRVKAIQALCVKHNKELVIYLSMGFGNPYGDPWHPDIVGEWTEKMAGLGVGIISLADTVGMADPETIRSLFTALIPAFPKQTIGAHFHAAPHQWEEKVAAAYDSGCTRFDSALKGYGGCPMAKDDLVGNLATEKLVDYLFSQGEQLGLQKEQLVDALAMAPAVFG